MGKRVFSVVVLAAALVLGICGCGSLQTSPSTVEQFATLGEAVDKLTEGHVKANSNELVYEGRAGTNYVYVWCDMTQELYEKCFLQDINKENTTVVKRQEVFTPAAQSERDALVGKTSGDLFAEDFLFEYYFVDKEDEMVRVIASKGSDHYMLVFKVKYRSGVSEDALVRGEKVSSVYVGNSSRPDDQARS